jgi:hypothetical protein
MKIKIFVCMYIMELNIQDIYENENENENEIVDDTLNDIFQSQPVIQKQQHQTFFPQQQHLLRQRQLQQQQQLENNKKQITYDNILSSLNMKVVNGKLQIVRNDGEEPQAQQPQKKQVAFQNQTQTVQYPNQYHNQHQNEMGPQIIYDEEGLQPQAIYIPMTKEEYKRKLAIQHLIRIQGRRNMERLKPRKMKFV